MAETTITLTIGTEEEVECTVTGDVIPYRPGNRFDPPEGGFAEGVKVTRDDSGADITVLLTPIQLEKAEQALMDDR